MSKLPKAPLIEVIFELHWPSNESGDLNKFEMILGAVFLKLEQEFPKTVHLRPDNQIPLVIFIDKPTHRFISPGDGLLNYPLYQLGPGLLTVNTIDDKYDWANFSELILKINNTLSKIYQFDPNKELTIVLKYLDFYKLDFNKDIRTSYRDLFNFNVDLKPAISKDISPLLLNIESAFNTPNGTISFSIKRGKITKNEDNIEGIIFESSIHLKINANNYIGTLTKWLNDSHESLSTFFKEITNGPTYQSFK